MREVRRDLQRQLPQGVELPPKHVWLLEPPCCRAAPPGVGGNVSGRPDGHAVGQQAAAPVF